MAGGATPVAAMGGFEELLAARDGKSLEAGLGLCGLLEYGQDLLGGLGKDRLRDARGGEQDQREFCDRAVHVSDLLLHE